MLIEKKQKHRHFYLVKLINMIKVYKVEACLKKKNYHEAKKST